MSWRNSRCWGGSRGGTPGGTGGYGRLSGFTYRRLRGIGFFVRVLFRSNGC